MAKASSRSSAYAGPFRGGLDQLTDPTYVNLSDFTEAFNCLARNGNIQKRLGFSQQHTVATAGRDVSYGQQFITRSGSRYLFATHNGTFYKLT